MEESKEQPDQPPPTSVTIHGDADVNYKWLEGHTRSVLLLLQKEQSEVSVQIVGDAEMARLHLKHSGIEGTTDVLTFDNSSGEKSVHADIAICIDVAKRESKSRKHEVQNELLLYIVHGILHCCGFDDGDEVSHSLMHVEEDRVLSAIGVGAVWSSES